jgi:hypothetical protein
MAGLSVPPEVGEVVDVDDDTAPIVAASDVLDAHRSDTDEPTMCPEGPVTVTVLDSAPEEYL